MALSVRNRKPAETAVETDFALDGIDRKILRLLQTDSLIANQALADRVGLSPPACLKRVRRLRAAGVIRQTAALLAAVRQGMPAAAGPS